MNRKDPYQIVKHLHVTEKATMLQGLKNADSNPSLKRCESPKYVFIVDPSSTKKEISDAVEEIYRDRGIEVVAVNTIHVKGKPTRHRGRKGVRASFKKAIVTLKAKDSIDDI